MCLYTGVAINNCTRLLVIIMMNSNLYGWNYSWHRFMQKYRNICIISVVVVAATKSTEDSSSTAIQLSTLLSIICFLPGGFLFLALLRTLERYLPVIFNLIQTQHSVSIKMEGTTSNQLKQVRLAERLILVICHAM